jgi:phosphodiesterase/alkaline phosphatase D-like protein
MRRREGRLWRGVNFAFATCQDWPSGYYRAYRDMLQHDLDLVLIWDDHEVANDCSGLAPEYDVPSPEFTARRAGAYQPCGDGESLRFEAALRDDLFLTGDWHSTFVNDLKLDFKDPQAATIATELVTPAITTGGDGTPYGPYYGPMVPFNPHIKHYDGDWRGYFKATVTPKQLALDLRFVTSVEDPNGTGYTERAFVIADGEPGAQPA